MYAKSWYSFPVYTHMHTCAHAHMQHAHTVPQSPSSHGLTHAWRREAYEERHRKRQYSRDTKLAGARANHELPTWACSFFPPPWVVPLRFTGQNQNQNWVPRSSRLIEEGSQALGDLQELSETWDLSEDRVVKICSHSSPLVTSRFCWVTKEVIVA